MVGVIVSGDEPPQTLMGGWIGLPDGSENELWIDLLLTVADMTTLQYAASVEPTAGGFNDLALSYLVAIYNAIEAAADGYSEES